MTLAQIEFAATRGLQRELVAIERDLKDRFDPYWAWDVHIEGALAEYAVALFYGVPWTGTVGQLDTPDVGPLQVRWVRRDSGYLPIRKANAKDHEWYVMVQGKLGLYRIVGVILCREGKRLGAQRADHWAVGQHLLSEPPRRLSGFPAAT
jgi:hypothetical protein